MQTLPPRPPSVAVTPDHRPGGRDALDRDPDGAGLCRDLPPELSPSPVEPPA